MSQGDDRDADEGASPDRPLPSTASTASALPPVEAPPRPPPPNVWTPSSVAITLPPVEDSPAPAPPPNVWTPSSVAITLPPVEDSPAPPPNVPASAVALTLPLPEELPRVRNVQTASSVAITLPPPDEPPLAVKTASSVAITLPPFDEPPLDAAIAPTIMSAGDETAATRSPSSLEDAALAATVAPAAANEATLPANDPSRDLPSFGAVDSAAYALGTEIARGGMGRILAARDRRLRRDVVVKVLRSSDAPSARFEREALITARLQHPSIVRIYDAGRLDGRRPFYAMERVRGQSLDRVIAAAPDFRARLALLPHVIAIADALAYAHNESIVHRDLKPANVLVGSYGETVVIDWGLAKDLQSSVGDSLPPHERAPSIPPEESSDGLTIAGSVMGTPAYMAPEQARGEPADARSDVYAIGGILYTVLTGKPPVTGADASAIVERVSRGEVTPLVEHVIAPPELVTIVERAMAFEPVARYATAKELADDLRHYAAGKLVASHSYTLAALLRRWLKRHRGVLAVGAFAVVALAIVSVLGVRRIVRERDRAERSERIAHEARAEIERKHDQFMLEQAHAALASDPSRALAWLRQLTERGLEREDARALADRAATAGIAFELVGARDDLEHVVIAEDGRTAYSGGDDGHVWKWDLAQQRGMDLGGHHSSVEALALSPDGRWLASGGTDDNVMLWELSTGHRHTLAGHTGAIRNVAFSPDGTQLASTGEDGALWLWDVTERTGRRALHDAHPLRPVAWNRDSTFVWVGTGDGRVLGLEVGAAFWIIPAPLTPAPPLRVHDGELRVLALSPDGTRLASGGEDGAVFVWTLDRPAPRKLAAHADVARDVLWTPDGAHVISAGGDRDVRVTALASGVSRVLAGNTAGVKDLALGHGGRLVASAGIDGALRVWPIEGGEPRVMRGHRGSIKSVAFAPDDAFVVSASDDDRLRVWSLAAAPPAPRGHALVTWIAARTNVRTEVSDEVIFEVSDEPSDEPAVD